VTGTPPPSLMVVAVDRMLAVTLWCGRSRGEYFGVRDVGEELLGEAVADEVVEPPGVDRPSCVERGPRCPWTGRDDGRSP